LWFLWQQILPRSIWLLYTRNFSRCRHGCRQAHFLPLGFHRHVFAAVCTAAAARIAYGGESGGDRRQTVRR